MAFTKRKHQNEDDLGFGNRPMGKNQRMMNADGTSNVKRIGLPIFSSDDTYNWLITMSWRKFMFIILIAYLAINILFACIYVAIGIENLNGAPGVTTRDHFFDAFFFSAQTISTVGYGHISPVGFITSCIAAFESMLGLLAFALATGLLYGRFSRPNAKILYSKNMVVAPYKDITGLMFRLANGRNNQLIEISVNMVFTINEVVDGKKTRRFFPLELERDKIGLLSLSWTVVHPIDEKSPLFGMTHEEMMEGETEVLILMQAFDDTFSQTVHSRVSYLDDHILFNSKFVSLISHDDEGVTTLDLSKLNTIEKVS
ncbi:MAG: ion transporter [Pedobacter sp.]|nr:MAG: ion transporter [Pedobacter sp.]